MADKEEKILCVWNMGTPCDGKREKKLMFSKQLEIPICEKHFEEHKEVMILHHQGYDIEEIVDMEPEERKRLVYTMVLAELDLSKVEV